MIISLRVGEVGPGLDVVFRAMHSTIFLILSFVHLTGTINSVVLLNIFNLGIPIQRQPSNR
jgi:hypothetical protein